MEKTLTIVYNCLFNCFLSSFLKKQTNIRKSPKSPINQTEVRRSETELRAEAAVVTVVSCCSVGEGGSALNIITVDYCVFYISISHCDSTRPAKYAKHS